jgi:Cu+-exporting ATPase
VCEMKVDRHKAVTKELGGETFYFCSNHCLHAFEADPDKYPHGNAPADQAHAHAHQ